MSLCLRPERRRKAEIRLRRTNPSDHAPPVMVTGAKGAKGGISVEIDAALGDITKESVDAIVNAANTRLVPGGGVCGAIHAAGGPAVAGACARIGHCATGDAVATGAGRLPARFVIHAVGPVWHGGRDHEAALLASAYRRSLDAAASVGARSVAFPAISTGIYGYPPDEAAGVAVAAVRAWDGSGIDLVRFMCFDEATLALYLDNLRAP